MRKVAARGARRPEPLARSVPTCERDPLMPQMRRTGAALAAALLSSGLAVVSPVLTTSADAAELLVDGGFEAATGSPPVSPGWTVADSELDTPICIVRGVQGGAAGRRGAHRHGLRLVRRYGHRRAHVEHQPGRRPSPRGRATLRYWFANPEISDSGQAARLDVTIDGKRVQTIRESRPQRHLRAGRARHQRVRRRRLAHPGLRVRQRRHGREQHGRRRRQPRCRPGSSPDPGRPGQPRTHPRRRPTTGATTCRARPST